MKKLLLLLLAINFTIFLSAQLVTPSQNGDIYSLEVGNVAFEVDASYGGRISSFKINDNDILWPAQNGTDFLWGSTFWPSPQTWPWPPPFENLNINPYSGVIQNDTIVLTSEKDDFNDLVFEKTFYAESADSSVTIEYKIINEGSSSFWVAGWEVTRVPSKGLTFFPRGEGNIFGAFASQFKTIDGVAWYTRESNDPTGQKMFSDGSDGWFAHVTDDDYLFLKTFEDVPFGNAATGEAEIELWQAGSYIELENQSVYWNISAGSSRTYKLKWYLKEIPEDVVITEGSESLLNYAVAIAGVTPGVNVEKDINNKVSLSVYPNPASEYIRIVGQVSENYCLSIYDITGKIVLSRELVKSNESVNVRNIKEGLYFYKIKGEKSTKEGKLLIR